MNERDRIALLAHRQEVEAEEERHRVERDRPLRDAEEKYKNTLVELGQLTRQTILEGADPDFQLDEESRKIRVAWDALDAHNGAVTAAFLKQAHDYYPCEANKDALLGYLERNGVQVLTVSTLTAAFNRLSEYGLLEERPAPEPEPVPSPKEEIILHEDQPSQQPEMIRGFDPETGLEVEKTLYQVERMSAEDYKRFARVRSQDLILCKRSW